MKLSELKDEIVRINSDKGNTELDKADNTIKMIKLEQESKALEAKIRRLQRQIKNRGGRRTTKKNKRSVIRRKYIKKTNKKKRNTKKKNTRRKN